MSVTDTLKSAVQIVPVLETSRLILRSINPDDFPAHLAIGRQPAFHRYLSAEPLSAEEHWKMLLRSMGHWAMLGYGFWAIEEKATGEYIGGAGYLHLKREIIPEIGDTPEIGWVLAPRVHGQGYASEAVAAVIAWGDAHFKHARTMCIIHPENEASLRLAHKFGYREYIRTTYHGDPIVMLERSGKAEEPTGDAAAL
ncbi:GNAT family N-acetyltransferase [Hymenobacter sp. B1770]|uniref:GNAT family N-acetyltransferase n=1 Tax=Hymenobacter sp. B1770 TaxID=1718788 RepID=UPI003CED41FA